MSKKYTTEYVKEYLESNGYTLVGKYVRSKDTVEIMCPRGHIYYTNFNNFKNQGCRCRKCLAGSRRHTVEYVKNYFLKNKYTPLFDEYTDNKTPLKTMCPKGHIYFVSFGSFKNSGNRCSICSNRKKYIVGYVKEYFMAEGYTPLFDEYVNKKTLLKVMCPKGHIYNVRFDNFKNGNSRCVTCSRDRLKGEGHPMYGRRGEKSSNWKDGISFDPYCPIFFNKEYKNSIKERDNNICQNPYCYKNDNRLHIHHIDYDKKNCGPDNLITVCGSCNARANKDRKWHTAWYQTIMSHKYGYTYK